MKAGFVGLIGQPNSGKSTLFNNLLDMKLSIVTEKPQTTRQRVNGIVTREEGQVIFVDAPGFIQTKKGLNAFLSQEVNDVIEDSDVLIAVLSPDEKKKESILKILELVQASNKPWFAIITKADLVDKKPRVAVLRDMISGIKANKPIEIFEYSSEWGKDLATVHEQIISAALKLAPQAKAPLFDPEELTPHTLRELSQEIIREKCFLFLAKEIPYSIAVQIISYDESNKGLVKIAANLMTAKESHKPIVIGKGGLTLKKIGTKARLDLEKLIQQKVYLNLNVISRPGWMENPRAMKELGYVIRKS